MLLDPSASQCLTSQASVPTREQIEQLEAQMRMMEQLPAERVHHVVAGMHAHEAVILAGTILPSKTYTHEHLSIVSKGRIAVWTDDGMEIIAAPHTSASPAGTHRVGFALEDTVWITIHANPVASIKEA